MRKIRTKVKFTLHMLLHICVVGSSIGLAAICVNEGDPRRAAHHVIFGVLWIANAINNYRAKLALALVVEYDVLFDKQSELINKQKNMITELIKKGPKNEKN